MAIAAALLYRSHRVHSTTTAMTTWIQRDNVAYQKPQHLQWGVSQKGLRLAIDCHDALPTRARLK